VEKWLLSPKCTLNRYQIELFLVVMATGFTLWLRNDDENLTLMHGDIEIDELNEEAIKYHRIYIRDRKVAGQVQVNNTNVPVCLQGYEVFPQPDQPSADCFKAINRWNTFIETTYPQRGKPTSEDWLFPHVKVPAKKPSSGTVDFKRRMDGGTFQILLDIVVEGAGLGGFRRTGHCFRRGGAQDKYILCKNPWSLHAVKWWGGWAKGESAATILKYLMNTEMVLENYFGNMLDPKRNHGRHAHRNALPDVAEGEGVSSSRLSLAAVESKLQSLEQMIQTMAKAQSVNSDRQLQLVTSLTASIKKIEVIREYLTFRLEERQSNQVLKSL
jgi:hypothetical protein